MKKSEVYWKLFKSSFHLSAFTFGGGYVIIPLMRTKFVEELGWIDEDEMMDLMALAQSSPGSLAVNASILVGYKVDGVMGAIFSILGTILPPLFLLTIISQFYAEFKSNVFVNAALHGMQAGVAAVIVDVVMTMARQVFNLKRTLPIVIMVTSFIAAYFLKINVLYIILAAGIVGALSRGGKIEVSQ
ncbi:MULTISPECIES: chromate transporter [unclassified Erysipelothrix]|uniref:chromate transporter n=1 Tax=unclassified Erysipelothrix TaxID=2624170 RepID=UPI001377F665|nr:MULTISPECIES: chromate transporter [unclassified Erysipelothrix]MBK2402987.1 chromate transporter [Erysipelothrix sp. strain 2 (EsS2-6-Brazil)]MBK2403522.1 chromate transporter [Erysipelothrix sp. strain 2 (EsS2-7-Brazil)]NBA01567.1 chromate transporter [Erysipelothrix rhusiopathiae]